jgi:hypothetical protein
MLASFTLKVMGMERTHKTILTDISGYVEKQTKLWQQWLPFACFCVNTTPRSITKYSPYEILLGRKCNLPGEIGENSALYNDDMVQAIRQRRRESHQRAQGKFKEKQQERVPEKCSSISI